MADCIIITGGAGFIGSCFVKKAIDKAYKVVVLDKLTYAGNLKNLASVSKNPNYCFVKGDICDSVIVRELLNKYNPTSIVNFAAESHVDNSISGPAEFITTNINGTFNLLNLSLQYFKNLPENHANKFRFIHISTDEVYGSLNYTDPAFSSSTPYAPNSPYSASKASSDHLCRAWFETYQLPVIITNCSNNFGPFQHTEKLIPKIISNAINGLEIPIYGNGKNIRDWIYVEDHVDGIFLALQNGKSGKKYLFGGNNELRNIDVAYKICDILEKKNNIAYRKQIKFVKDRPGHDFRYAIDNSEVSKELGFKPSYIFDTALEETINWYIK